MAMSVEEVIVVIATATKLALMLAPLLKSLHSNSKLIISINNYKI
jgi:hypothetical protein